MRNDQASEFQRLLTDALAFYGKDVSTFALSVWWEACQPFDMEQVRKAMTTHATDPEHGQFAPKPADIVKALQGTKTDRALMAWSTVYRAFSEVGAYASPEFGDNATHAAINDMGGWPKLCHISTDELPFTQKRFCDLYRAHNSSGYQEPVQLIGLHAEANGAKAISNRTEPVRVGMAARRLQVVQ